MGWKAVRDHYQVTHIVHRIAGKGICIGSPYVSEIIVISDTGVITKRPDDLWNRNEQLLRYLHEMEADPELLAGLIAKEDTFEAAIPVFTWEGAEILELACEALGYPNVTHDGRLMWENAFSTDRREVVEWAIRSARASIEALADQVAHREQELDTVKERLAGCKRDLVKLLNLEAIDV